MLPERAEKYLFCFRVYKIKIKSKTELIFYLRIYYIMAYGINDNPVVIYLKHR